MAKSKAKPKDYDTPWKEALDKYFPALLQLFLPLVFSKIDWAAGYTILNKELAKLSPDALQNKLFVDHLVQVTLLDSQQAWIWVHIEVQSQKEASFPLRMYNYRSRLRLMCNKSVFSVAILADNDPNWRPTEFTETLFGCTDYAKWETIKLLDWADHIEELEASDNVFAPIVLAQLLANQTTRNAQERVRWKLRFVKNLLKKKLPAEDIHELFRLIDWLMQLPEPEEEHFWHEIEQMDKEQPMPFISTVERMLEKRGLEQGIQLGREEGQAIALQSAAIALQSAALAALTARFGELSGEDEQLVKAVTESAKLISVVSAVAGGSTLDDIREILAL